MKKTKNRRHGIMILSVVCLLAFATAATFVVYSRSRDFTELPISYMSAMSEYDPADKRIDTGFVDYVFVGRVTKYLRTEQEKRPKGYFTPYTVYEIEVLENLKGNLNLGTIEIEKLGGVRIKGLLPFLGIGLKRVVFENDFLPEAGDVCIFYANTQPDQSLHVSGAYSNILLEQWEEGAAAIQTDSEYLKAVDACENEIPYERERFVSIYDASNAD